MDGGHGPDPVPDRCASSGRVFGRSSGSFAKRSGRPARPGGRRVRRCSRRADGAGGRYGSARRYDGFVDDPDGVAGRLRTGGGICNFPLVEGEYKPPVLGLQKAKTLLPAELCSLPAGSKQIAVLDLASGAHHMEGHIPGSFWAIRSRLDLSKLPAADAVVLTSEDGVLAHLAAGDLQKMPPRKRSWSSKVGPQPG